MPDQTYSIKLGSLVVHKNDVQTKSFSLELVKNTEWHKFPGLRKNSSHLFKRYYKCPQSVPFLFANAGYVDFGKTCETHSSIQHFLILLLSFFRIYKLKLDKLYNIVLMTQKNGGK